MSLSIVHSRAQIGVEAPAVTVEVHLANGLPSLTMVGLPEAAVKESKDRGAQRDHQFRAAVSGAADHLESGAGGFAQGWRAV
jgi:hypothetical protein